MDSKQFDENSNLKSARENIKDDASELAKAQPLTLDMDGAINTQDLLSCYTL
jgi:hypothetical protein